MDSPAAIATACGKPKPTRRGFMCCCPAHDDNNPSMEVWMGEVAVLVHCYAGCDPNDIIAALKARGMWDGAAHQDPVLRPRPVSHETVAARRQDQLRALARGIFEEAGPIDGTLAERYFDQRFLLSVASTIADIRFHPRCPRADQRQPAAVIAMRNLHTHAVTAVQRIFLDRQARKDGAMMLGQASGAAMKLQRLIGGRLHIAEGLETGLALIAMDHAPVWALGSAGAIKAFPVLDNIRELCVWADHDRPGLEAAEACEARWIAAGKPSTIYRPRQEGWDQADVWSSRCGRL